MAGHRYQKVIFKSSNDYNYVGLSELEMMIAVGGSSVCAGGTAISSSNYPGTTAANLFDGSTSSQQANQASTPIYDQQVGYDFGAGNEKSIVQIRITPRSDALTQAPNTFQILYSDDNITYTLAGSYTGETGQTSAARTYLTTSGTISPRVPPYSDVTLRLTNNPTIQPLQINNDSVLAGNITALGVPIDNVTLQAYEEDTKVFSGQTRPNSSGYYELDRLDSTKKYFVIAKSDDNKYEYKISSRRTPQRQHILKGRIQDGIGFSISSFVN